LIVVAAALPFIIPILTDMGLMGAGIAGLVLAALAVIRWHKILRNAIS